MLPGIFESIKLALAAFVEASKDFKLLVAEYTKWKDAQWKQDLSDIRKQLGTTMTVEEKANAAKKLDDLIARLG